MGIENLEVLTSFEMDMLSLVRQVQDQIEPDFRAFEGDTAPGIQLTVGYGTDDDWGYQTGDNSFSGGAYPYPIWAVIGVYEDSVPIEMVEEIVYQIRDQQESSND